MLMAPFAETTYPPVVLRLSAYSKMYTRGTAYRKDEQLELVSLLKSSGEITEPCREI